MDNLNIGPPIAKGCSAVVYAAAIKPAADENEVAVPVSSPVNESLDFSPNVSANIRHEMMSPIQNTSRFLHNFGGSVDNLYFNRNERSRLDSISESKVNHLDKKVHFNTMINVLHSHDNVAIISNSSSDGSGVTNDTNINVNASVFNDNEQKCDVNTVAAYPLALKMMFNYDIQSNAMTILRAMYKETIPARNKQLIDTDGDNWQKL